MKTKLFAAVLAAMTLVTGSTAAAHEDDRRGERRWRQEITVRKDGHTLSFDRGDRMFYRLLDRPYNFRPGLTYAYTDRCNRYGCIAFVFNSRSFRPIDRIFAPHLPDRRYAWRAHRGFDRGYSRFGSYERAERGWDSDDDRRFREDRDYRDWDRDGRRR